MLAVALNYEGTDSPLNCVVDARRLSKIAKQSGVRDLVKLYDTGATKKFPCKHDVEDEIRAMAARCKPGDYFVFHYSGHGTCKENSDDDAVVDSLLCLRTRDGEDEEWLDEEIADIIVEAFDPSIHILFLADACCSAGVLDIDTRGLWGGREYVCAISGCQNEQCSEDTGDGGAMTNALVKCLRRKKVREMRRNKQVSIQYIFNRMVEFMPDEDEEDEDDDEDEEESGDDDGSGSETDCEEDADDDDDEDEECDVDPITGEERNDGQDMNLSWPGGAKDPSKMPFPF